MENNENNQNGHAVPNRILAFVNRVEPFTFELDGLKVSGEWWKYKTTTPQYKNDRDKRLSELQEKSESIPKKLETITDDIEREAKRLSLSRELESELNAYALSFFTDTIKRWEDEDGNEIPLTLEVFQQIPEPFSQALARYFKDLREQTVNPTKPPNSPSG